MKKTLTFAAILLASLAVPASAATPAPSAEPESGQCPVEEPPMDSITGDDEAGVEELPMAPEPKKLQDDTSIPKLFHAIMKFWLSSDSFGEQKTA